MACSFCGHEQVVAKGLCSRCYYRAKNNNGDPAYRKWGKPRGTCSVEGCHKPVVAHGICQAHYLLRKKYNDVVSPFGYGERQKHPLYQSWCSQRRCAQGRAVEWEDFWKFVLDVGIAPPNHSPKRVDITQPWGPDNFTWVERFTCDEARKAYMREYGSKNPMKHKQYGLKRQFGVTLEWYLSEYDKQGGKCKLCGKPGEAFNSVTGRTTTLAVDHCHKTGAIRGLLCQDCNKGLGSFKDNPEVMRAAADYVEKYK